MQEFTIRLHSVRDVNEFVTFSAPLHSVILSDGNRSVDGKSFMEIFCLQLAGPISVSAECSEAEYETFRQNCRRFWETN